MLAVGADAIGVKGPTLPDLPEDLAGAAHLATIEILKHHQIQLVAGIFLLRREARPGAFALGAQRLSVGGQVGEAAARQLRHPVTALPIALFGRPDHIITTIPLSLYLILVLAASPPPPTRLASSDTRP